MASVVYNGCYGIRLPKCTLNCDHHLSFWLWLTIISQPGAARLERRENSDRRFDISLSNLFLRDSRFDGHRRSPFPSYSDFLAEFQLAPVRFWVAACRAVPASRPPVATPTPLRHCSVFRKPLTARLYFILPFCQGVKR